MDFVVYDEAGSNGASYRVAATALPEGTILESVYVYKNRSVLTEIDCSIGSIHLKEESGSSK